MQHPSLPVILSIKDKKKSLHIEQPLTLTGSVTHFVHGDTLHSIGWLVGFTAYQHFSGYLTPN